MLGGAGLGFWLTGKPRRAWVGAWHQCMGSVHGMVCMGLVGLGLSIGVWFWMMFGDVIIPYHAPILYTDAMHRPMHGAACPSTKTPIPPHLT